eukprot:XP_028334580.1 mucin-5AC [Physeter catodon]
MGVGRRKLALLWALGLTLACAQHTGQARDSAAELGHEYPDLPPAPQGPGGNSLRGVTIHPPLRNTLLVRALHAAHGGRVCSTWGDFHYKTFDGDVFRFPGLCNYVFSAHCGAAYEDFNLQLRRGPGPNATAPSRVTMKLDGVVVELTKSSVLVNDRPIQLPFSHSGVLIEHSGSYVKVAARLGLVFMWNQDDSLLLELDAKYANQTCGLCGDFNGVPVFNEFFVHDIKLTPTEFGNLQKMDGPTEQCQDPAPEPRANCLAGFGICEEILSSKLFSDCAALVDTSSYLEACRQDLCHCDQANVTSCLCDTLAEYSRQCTHAGGLPLDWRGPQLCPQTCPLNMQYRECGSPCTDTCSNLEHSQLCEDHCMAGCFCPEGTVLDDIGHTGCILAPQCSCVYNGATYTPGTGYSTDCTNCTCSGGRWRCQEVQCPGTCSVLGGAHFSTFDERQYTVHGDCSYMLAKPCDSSAFTVLAELRRCGLTESETCLKSLTLILGGGHMVFVVKASGEVFVNQIYTQLPLSAANVTLFRPSTFFIIAQTQLGLQLDIQLVPRMQVFVRLAPRLRGQTCGLCGNFNQNQADDFRTTSGVVEGTAAAFANTWKTQAACPNVKNSFEVPCSLSVENEKYAQHWCSRLTDPHGPFTRCHAAVDPSAYYSNCMFDTCSCEKSEDCMCAALSSYVRACAARGVLLGGWRDGVCTKPMTTCPKSLTYLYNISTCQPTCRARSDVDVTCSVSFVPVDGCTCPDGTFLDDTGKCVPATSCPCYHGGSVVPNGESTHEQGVVCTCTQGTLTCIGGHAPAPVCTPPMVYLDCGNTTPGAAGAAGAGCQKSCHTLDMDCYSSQCVPGCVCPHGLVATGDGGCIPVSDCPCMHNEASYQPGQTIRVGCNTCTCKSRMWQCTDRPCPATCAVYGDGHYITFDGRRYSFSGACEYTLLQDHCGGNGSAQDGFRVITENVPCGTTGTTCSKAIKIFLGSYELKLSYGNVEVIEKEQGQLPPFSIRQMGTYLVVDTDVSLVLLWDKGTSIFLRLSPEFKGRVCGLCGNFDDNALNDFTTRSQSVVGDALEFGNSWKFSPSCPDAQAPRDPCAANPYRKSWAQKRCSIINGAAFRACRSQVDSTRYYEACVSDACACDSGGDCECFCTAVAAYAQACRDAGVCVAWRTPDVCPLFCDYYNPHGGCEWHYQPCGAPCLRTCRNPRGQYLHNVRGLEGCYPKCPSEAPIFDEDQMRCVASCPTPTPPPPCRVQGKSYRPGSAVPSEENCHRCVCTESGVQCTYDSEACVCTYDGRRFHPGEVIYHTMDGTGGCISARCGANGTIERRVEGCTPTTPTPQTTFSFSTSLHVVSSTLPPSTRPSPSESTAHTPGTSSGSTPPTASALPSSRSPCGEECQWSPWLDVSRPGRGIDSGDFDTLENLRAYGYRVCREPRAVECRAERAPEVPLEVLGQRVECSLTVGLTCYNRDQASGHCDNYQIRILCCFPRACPTSSTEITPPATFTTTETGPTRRTSGVTPVPTGGTDSSAPVTTPGPTPASATSKAPGPGTSTPGKTTLLTPSPTPVSTTVSTTTSVPTPTPTPTPSKGTTSEPTQACLQESCTWTKWIDGSYPGPGRNSGDFDTFQNLRSKGYKFCAKPRNVQCRAEAFPNTPLQALGQDVICDKKVGLICWNKDQLPPICYNYQIRILCCEMVDHCRTTTSRPTTPGPIQTTTGETSTAWTAATFSSSTQHSTASSAHVSPRTRVTPRTNEQNTSCQPQCLWTKWFDVDFPSPGPHGGDLETYSNIVRRGERICHRPEYISALECRAENHRDVSIQTLGQVVQCSPEVGLVCRNRDQKGKFRMCLNYEVRVLCCEPQKGCTGTQVTFPSTSSVSVTSQTGTSSHEATSRATAVQTTSPTAVPITSTTSVETTNTTPTTSPTTSTSTVETTSTTSAPTTSTTTVETSSTTSAPTRSTISVQTTSPTSAPTTSTRTVETTSPTTAPTTSTSTPQCLWTKWFDVDFPSPGPHGGDFETYSNIVRRGERICHRPEYISALECRAENHRDVSIQTLGQVVQCSPEVGLVCRNRDQKGKFRMCLNYEVRVLCCEPQKGCTGTQVTFPSTSSVSVTSQTGTSSHEATSRATAVQTTSPTAVPITSTTSVETTNTTSAPTRSTTTVETPSPTSAFITSTTTVETTSPTTVPRTGTTTVETTSTTSAPTTSTTTVETTRTTSVETTSPSTAPRTSTTTCGDNQPIHSSYNQHHHCGDNWPNHSCYHQHHHCGDNRHNLSSYRKHNLCADIQPNLSSYNQHPHCGDNQPIHSSYNQHHHSPTTSTTTVETTSTTSAPTRSTISVQTSSRTSAPTTSTSTVETTSTTIVETTRTTSVETTSPTSAPTISTTTVETTSTTSAPTRSTISVQTSSRTSAPTTSTSTVETTSTTIVETTRTTSVETTSPTSAPTISTTTVETTSTTSAPTRSTISVQTSSRTSAPTTSTSTVETTSTTIVETTRTTSVETTSPTSAPTTSTSTVETTSPSSAPTISTTTVETTSPTSTPTISTTTVETTSTTSAPTTSTTLVPVSETTHSQSRTTSCQPQCLWTKWFDVVFPSPGPHGGDFETYSNIVRRGERICHRPEYISALECRAENHRDVSIQTLGQVVQCSPEVGLVCRNRDQKGKFRMCLNYEVRVLCCEPQKGCTGTSATPFVTSSPQSSLSPKSTPATLSLATSPSSAPPSTSTCYCSVAHRFYPAGSIIYQQTDLSGHCYYAVCSPDCHVVRRTDHTCPTSTPPPTPATSATASSVTVIQRGCPNAVPPRMKGETWAMPNCTEATCEGNGAITVRSRQCPKVQELTCANGYPAVKVANREDCCPHYECQCVCSGWGDPHYITFDGTYYTFLDNCTYVLVQQIVPVFGHFRVLIDNYFCDAEDGLSCPQSIIVEYRQDRVVLTRKPVGGVVTNEIIFNGGVVRPGFQKDGIVVSQIGIKMYVTIPALGVQVMFSGLIFSVELPFSKFANNTEGQCGTCTNDRKDECRLPGGAVVPSCSDMSGHWNVTYPGEPPCHRPPRTPTTAEPNTSPTSCPPSPICQLILSEVFKPCHSVIPPWPYYHGCTFDQCHMPREDVVCSSLELYAALCASLNVCIDWRDLTNHTCPFTCPADKVYRPCGPSNPSYCYTNDSANTLALLEAIPITEGCFCREDMVLFSSSTEVCVPANCSSCLGPHGEPVEPGHTVSVDCQECSCKGSTRNLSCQTRPCPPPPACPEPGLVPVPVALQTGQCCPQYTCACNTTHCPAPVDCPEGSRSVLTYKEGACCPTPKCGRTVCSINGTLYQPGAIVSSNLCEKCWCELPGGPQSDTFVISCETQICSTRCPVGFEYQTQSGQCCGECVQVACVMNTSDSSAHLLRPGESWPHAGSRCVTHQCEKYRNGLVLVTTEKACPPLRCPADEARLSEDGCCHYCPPPPSPNKSTCAVRHELQVLRQPGCSSVGPVRLAYCQGNCGDTTSVYSLEAHSVRHTCRCCRELRASLRNVTLHCEDGSSQAFSYTEVEECGCVGLHCDPHGGLGHSGEVQMAQGAGRSQETGLRRRRRGAPAPRPLHGPGCAVALTGLQLPAQDQPGWAGVHVCAETTGPSTAPRTSTTTVEPTSTSRGPTISTTTVETTSPTTAPRTSTTTVETASPTTGPTTSTTIVETTGPPTAPRTSTTTVETTSTTTVATTSTTSAPTRSTISVQTTSPTTAPTTSTTTVETTSTSSAPTRSTISVETTSPTSAPTTSTSTVETTSPSSAPTISTTTVETTSPTSTPTISTTTVEATSTTSAPTTSTTLVPVSETTHSQSRTTSCQPQCLWTKWFDVDFPSPGPHGGDLETYSNIVRRGERICHRPEYISALECRAENHRDVSIQTLGQVVQCSPEVGLVCRNRDQKGKFRMCLNYEVRVLCCEPQKGCTGTSATPFVTSSPQSSLSPKSTPATLSLATSPSSAPPSTSTCYCSVAHRFYPAGSIIYQQTDLSGHCYYAVCSPDCHVVRRTDHTCPTSTPPPTPATSATASSVTVIQRGCPNAVPPRMKGETWAMPNCTEATCEGNGAITVRSRQCPKVQELTCANGYPAVKVANREDCCPHYECQCVCSGWGDPHYITFDGTYYTFLDNCTYVLVQQIVPVFGHFRVLIDNYFCDAEDGLSCPQSIIVEYRQDRVVLTRKPVGGVVTNEIIFNGGVVRPGFQKDGIVVSQIGIKMYVTIPALGVQVMFSGLIFSVELPFSKFANNTEGQCGTCTNDRKDECRLPGGAVVPSCSDMSGHWNVTYPGEPPCHRPPRTPTTAEPNTSPTSCPPSPICQLILSEVFKPCHSVIPPWPYYHGCTFDQCHMPREDVVCSSLELYAALCASLNVCIDWRDLTNHTCPFTCPADKVYRPCGPSNPSYCYTNDSANTLALLEAIPITEGCFCREDMVLFSSSTEVCVPANCSSCLGPHGEPVEPGHTVSVDCQECSCKGSTRNLSCQTRPCPPPPACPEPGLVPVPVALQTGQCCPQYTCACNTTHCPAPVDCPEGSRSVLTYKEGACCPTPKCGRTVCSINGTLYQPGAIVSSNLCEKCWCELPGGPQSDTFVISCETQICSTRCPVGFEYQTQSGQCCGECVQVACVMNTSDSSAHLLRPGESWPHAGSRCVTHQCEKYRNGLVLVTTEKACPPLRCPADEARLSEDGCCHYCPPPPSPNKSTCAVRHELQVLRQPGCSSVGPVRLAYCQGNCGDTTSVYSLEAHSVRHTCRCCRELRASLRNVTLHCEDGSSQAFSYTEVEECGCVGLHCDPHGGLGHSGEVQMAQGAGRSQETGLRRRRRGAPAPRPLQ